MWTWTRLHKWLLWIRKVIHLHNREEWFVLIKCFSFDVSKNALPIVFVCFLIKNVNKLVDFSGDFFFPLRICLLNLLNLLHTSVSTHEHSNAASCSQMQLLKSLSLFYGSSSVSGRHLVHFIFYGPAAWLTCSSPLIKTESAVGEVLCARWYTLVGVHDLMFYFKGLSGDNSLFFFFFF